MKKRICIALLAVIAAAAPAMAQSGTYAKRVLSQIDKIGRALILINNNYVDTIQVEKMSDSILKEMLHTLDPHSEYIPAEDVDEANEHLLGSFSGVGIEFALISDTITVQRVIPGGPSEKVGIMAGDRFIRIDTTLVAGVGIKTEAVRRMLRGEKDTKVTVSVLRRGSDTSSDYTITRGKVPLNSLETAYAPEPGVMYIKLSTFAAYSALEIYNAFKYHFSESIPTGVILDLRDNGGGYLNVAISIANMFLDAGQRVVYTEGAHVGFKDEILENRGFYLDRPLVVLVNENSASSSEIVAGALQDWDRGIIIGRRTFGKGLVQRLYTLDDGSQIRLTVARYHTPTGRVIQSPYEEGKRREYYTSKSSLGNSDLPPDSLRFETLVQHRTVYGGGGILPDIIIPRDTSYITGYLNDMVRTGIYPDFINGYCDTMRNAMKPLSPDYDTFCEVFDSQYAGEAMATLEAYAASRGLEPVPEEMERSKRYLITRTKAQLARHLFGDEGYWRVFNSTFDPEFEKALEVIRNWPSRFPDHAADHAAEQAAD